MGSYTSKTLTEEQLRTLTGNVNECLRSHERNVEVLSKTVDAKHDSLKILLGMLSEWQERLPKEDGRLQYPGEVTELMKTLLQNIQDVKKHECQSLSESFHVLHNCIVTTLDHVTPGMGSSIDTKKFDMEKPNKAGDTSYGNHGAHQASKGAHEHRSRDHQHSQGSSYVLSLQEEVSTLQDKIRTHESDLKGMSKEIQTLKDRNIVLDRKLSTKTAENEKLQNRNQSLEGKEHELKNVQWDLKNSKYEIQKFQRKIGELEAEVWKFKEEKQKIKERKVAVPVQLYYQRKGEPMSTIADELCAMLKTQMETKNINLEIQRCDNIGNIQSDKATLVLCINASRLGTDASTAIEGVQRSGRIALLIFHHKNIHALPNQPSERMLTSPEFKALGGIFDLAFLNGKGIYTCDMNNNALSGLEEFIKKSTPSDSGLSR